MVFFFSKTLNVKQLGMIVIIPWPGALYEFIHFLYLVRFISFWPDWSNVQECFGTDQARQPGCTVATQHLQGQ